MRSICLPFQPLCVCYNTEFMIDMSAVSEMRLFTKPVIWSKMYLLTMFLLIFFCVQRSRNIWHQARIVEVSKYSIERRSLTRIPKMADADCIWHGLWHTSTVKHGACVLFTTWIVLSPAACDKYVSQVSYCHWKSITYVHQLHVLQLHIVTKCYCII